MEKNSNKEHLVLCVPGSQGHFPLSHSSSLILWSHEVLYFIIKLVNLDNFASWSKEGIIITAFDTFLEF